MESNAKEVAAVVAGYVAKKLINSSQCVECQNQLTTTGSQQSSSEFDYLLKLSRGGLILHLWTWHNTCRNLLQC